MRVGDFSVEVIGAGGGPTRELDSGHVVARPGQVYVLRPRNHGPLRCVADVSIDGNGVTGNGLVINPWSTVDLERPIHATERGRFTVIAEGDERVFGHGGDAGLGDAILDSWLFAGNDNRVRDVMVQGAWCIRDGYHEAEESIGANYADTMRQLLA